jgi:hypothetical protein
MQQWFALDRPDRFVYYLGALSVVGLAACGVKVATLAPAVLPTLSQADVAEIVALFVPTAKLRYELRWTYQTQQGTTRGRATVHFVPPDSVRFDYRAPFGRSGAAVIVGDDMVWSRPEDDVQQLIQVAPVFWAALGIPRDAPAGAVLTGRVEGDHYQWRYALAGDTLTYAVERQLGGTFAADLRQLSKVVASVSVAYDSTLRPATAQMVFPESASTVIFSVQAIDTLTTVDESIWREP